MSDITPTQQSKRRWIGAALGAGMAVADMVAAALVGVTFRIADHDVFWPVMVYLVGSLGGLGFAVGWLMDLRRTDRHRAAELADARARLAENATLAALGQMASTVAHEVRNPLAVVRSTVQTVRDDLVDGHPDEAVEQCDFALEEIDRLDRVVDGVLGLARPLEAATTPVPVPGLFARVEGLGARLLAERGVHLEATARPLTVSADADLACQALLGLVANAADVAPRGTAITLAASAVSDGVELTVSDRGPGVPPELRTRVFEPFYTTRPEGTGLGLAVVRQIARAHGGRVTIDDAPGGGARFGLVLPRAEAA